MEYEKESINKILSFLHFLENIISKKHFSFFTSFLHFLRHYYKKVAVKKFVNENLLINIAFLRLFQTPKITNFMFT